MVNPRTQSRRYAALVLYQWRLSGETPQAIKRHLLDDAQWLNAVNASLSGTDEDEPEPGARYDFDTELLDGLVSGVPEHLEAIDAALDAVLDRPISQVDPVELAILRLGTFEILFSPSVPNPVAINEAVELTKLLGAFEGHRYVNGVLDKIARGKPAAHG